MKILVTGAAGFIGFHVAKRLLDRGDTVTAVDNLNNYYDVSLKQARLEQLLAYKSFSFYKHDLADREGTDGIFNDVNPEYVIHLAAQAGVRYSLENPHAYIDANIVAFMNILEACRKFKITNLIYGSSSSVYGDNNKLPFSIDDNVDHPVSFYAATKKSNELFAHVYSHLFGIRTTGLRFFTVYGPWGRPDMAYFKFAHNIVNGKPIEIFNNGNHRRDFTYIDDIVDGVLQVLDRVSKHTAAAENNYSLYNLGFGRPVKLIDFVSILEHELGKKTEKILLPKQPGDVDETFADISKSQKDFGYSPQISLEMGLRKFCEWFRDYYEVKY
jgi:UDP-glucuronate 4-epimerase